MSATVTEPQPQPLPKETIITFPLLPTSFALADCECDVHDSDHTAPGPCDQRAQYRLTARGVLSDGPSLIMLLCQECVDWRVRHLQATRPTLEVRVYPLDPR